MIKKEITMNDGKKYIVGFTEEYKVAIHWVKCHILKRKLFIDKIVYTKIYVKGLMPNYKEFALWTILDYERECEQQESLLIADWS